MKEASLFYMLCLYVARGMPWWKDGKRMVGKLGGAQTLVVHIVLAVDKRGKGRVAGGGKGRDDLLVRARYAGVGLFDMHRESIADDLATGKGGDPIADAEGIEPTYEAVRLGITATPDGITCHVL